MNPTITALLKEANAQIEYANNAREWELEQSAQHHLGMAHGIILALQRCGHEIQQIGDGFRARFSFAAPHFAIAGIAIFATFAGFGSPAEIAQWQNNLRQDAAIYRANAADCRTTAHKDRETVARKLEREADKADALAAAMTDKLAAAYASAAAAENAAHRALVEWQKANTAKAADEAEKDAAATRALCESHKAQRRLKKAQNAALKNAAK